jgi:hypothetical protein
MNVFVYASAYHAKGYCMYVYACMCSYARTYVRVYICMYVGTYVRMYVYKHTCFDHLHVHVTINYPHLTILTPEYGTQSTFQSSHCHSFCMFAHHEFSRIRDALPISRQKIVVGLTDGLSIYMYVYVYVYIHVCICVCVNSSIIDRLTICSVVKR